jgi:hypothetical protein
MSSKPVRVAAVAESLRAIPAPYAELIHAPLLAAEAKLEDVMDILDERGLNSLADALQWLRDDVKALRRAVAEARLA